MAINNRYELVLRMTQNGQKLVNRFLYRQEAADGAMTPELSLANAFNDNVVGLYKAVTSNELSFQSIIVRRVSPTPGGGFSFAIDDPGDVADDPLPPNSVAVVALYPSVPVKRFQGRFHVSGIPEDENVDGVIDEAYAGQLQMLGNAIVAAISAGGGEPDFQAGLYSETGAAFFPFVSARVRNHYYTLRSRAMDNP